MQSDVLVPCVINSEYIIDIKAIGNQNWVYFFLFMIQYIK